MVLSYFWLSWLSQNRPWACRINLIQEWLRLLFGHLRSELLKGFRSTLRTFDVFGEAWVKRWGCWATRNIRLLISLLHTYLIKIFDVRDFLEYQPLHLVISVLQLFFFVKFIVDRQLKLRRWLVYKIVHLLFLSYQFVIKDRLHLTLHNRRFANGLTRGKNILHCPLIGREMLLLLGFGFLFCSLWGLDIIVPINKWKGSPRLYLAVFELVCYRGGTILNFAIK